MYGAERKAQDLGAVCFEILRMVRGLSLGLPSRSARTWHQSGFALARFAVTVSAAARRRLEATPGIEPGFTDLQSAASPLRHVAPLCIRPACKHGVRRQARPISEPAAVRQS